MEMFQVKVSSEGSLITISQEDEAGKNVIVLHRDQVHLLTEWLKNEYCAYRPSGFPVYKK